MELIVTLAVIAALITLLYRGTSLLNWTLALAGGLLALWAFGPLGAGGFFLLAVLLVGPFALLNHREWRIRLISSRAFKAFKATLPNMNDTEREALEAGTVWWEAELFRGRPDWPKLRDFDCTKLTQKEIDFLANETETLCEMLDEWEIGFKRQDLPPKVWKYIRTQGFFAMLIPEEHGGLGFSAYAQSCVVGKIATRSISAAVTVMVPNSLGPGELLYHYGTDEQKDFWLPRLADGTDIPCFGLTGPEAGSDASAVPDVGVVFERDGELHMRLNFAKRYITLAPVATVVGLAIKLRDPDNLMSKHGLGEEGKVDYGITCVLLPADTQGVEIGRRHFPVGSPFMNGPINGEGVELPLSNIIGGPAMAGKGWRMLVECLSAGRGISLPALSAASGWGIYGGTSAYVRIRRQFNLPIGKFEGVQELTGRIAGTTYMLEACRTVTASAVDHVPASVVTAMMKYHMTEMMRRVVIDAMDIHGGRGVMQGPRNYLAAPYMSLPVAITVEGANVMTRSLIIFGQGAIRCHPYVFPEMEAARNPDEEQGLKDFDHLLFSHIGYSVNRAVRSFLLALSGGRLASAPTAGRGADAYRQMERYSAALAFFSDVAMGTLGGDLKRKERISARLGDVLSHLYMASAVIKYFEDRGRLDDDWVHARWSLDYCLGECARAFEELIRNYPIRPVAWLMKLLIQPFGPAHHGPSDKVTQQLAELFLQPNAFAERAYELSYHEDDPRDVSGRMKVTADLLNEIAEPYDVLHKGIKSGQFPGETLTEHLASAVEQGALSKEQAIKIVEYDNLRYEAILTNAFTKDYITSRGKRGSAGVGPRIHDVGDGEQAHKTADMEYLETL